MATTVDTQVAIIGAGPAGLVLSHLLDAAGIESIVLERHDRTHVEQRVRAGVLEAPTVDLLRSLDLARRLDAEGMAHRGVELAFAGRRHRLDFIDLVGASITVYGQQEVVKDLIAARLAAGHPIVFTVQDTTITDLDTDHPTVSYRHDGEQYQVRSQVVAGCDGFHGISRPSIPGLTLLERDYPFGWLGVLAEAPPTQDELVYAAHDRGFALYSMRSPTVTRLYLQVPAGTDLDDWPDDRIWDELDRRLPTDDGFKLATGPIIERGITGLRSAVAPVMQYRRLLLAGDAAHIVPPTGAKGMNLAVADAAVMAPLLDAALNHGRWSALDAYTELCLRRVWRTQHFSWRMTTMLHRLGHDPFQRQLQLAELTEVTGNREAAIVLARNYVGLPFGPVDPGGVRIGGRR
ncbi:MAG: 4-hydroxybenzoate 3-monooxygenase [Acidimicrobiales bacterium]